MALGSSLPSQAWQFVKRAVRDNRERSLTITIGELPSQAPTADRDDRRVESWGVTVTAIFPEIARRFRLESGQEGVIVIAIERDNPAARAGIQVGDVIEEVNRQSIRSLEDFDKAVKAAKGRDMILLLIRRGDSRFISGATSAGPSSAVSVNNFCARSTR